MKVFEKAERVAAIPAQFTSQTVARVTRGKKSLRVCYRHCCIFKLRPTKRKEGLSLSPSLAKTAHAQLSKVQWEAQQQGVTSISHYKRRNTSIIFSPHKLSVRK